VAGRAEEAPGEVLEEAPAAAPPLGLSDNGRRALRIGVLAIQGDFEAHAAALERLGAQTLAVRRPEQLTGLDALVIPGGESTTITKGITAYGFEQPIADFVASRRPVLGTCAGLIVLDRAHLGLMDIEARRNAFGRQVRSFEAEVEIRGLGDEPVHAVFIRAPWIEEAGAEVEVLAELDGHPIVARERNLLVAAFHPELTDDLRLHALFLAMMEERKDPPARNPSGGLPTDGLVS
jgi:pyridoxal 5'-phosphate synthase pdxT subunit